MDQIIPAPAPTRTEMGNLSSLTTTEKGSIVGAINEVDAEVSALNSNIANKTGSCTSSYGTIEYVRTGNVVQLTIACTGIASNAWTTISSDVPKAKKNCAFVGSDQSAGGNVALSITGTSLAFYGRGQYTTCNCAVLYIAE